MRARFTCLGAMLLALPFLTAPGVAEETIKTKSDETAVEQPAPRPAGFPPMMLIDNDILSVRARFEATFGAFAYKGSFYGLSAAPSPDYRMSRTYAESWFAPGVEFALRPVPQLEIYGGLSVGAVRTFGSDIYAQRNEVSGRIENAYVGVCTKFGKDALNIDISTGHQKYGVGTGMLVWQGAVNGFERGGLNLMPRIAWANASIARATFGGLKAEAFYLSPSEPRSQYTGTKLAGGVVEYAWGERSRIGGAYIRVPHSLAVYPTPTATTIDEARRGLVTWHGYSLIDGSPIGLPNAYVRGEGAIQRNARINMKAWAYLVEGGYRFIQLPFAPQFSLGYASFSGTDRNSTTYGRFDPLFYGNGLDNWWFGANQSYALLNSNVNHIRAALQLAPSASDFVKVQYVYSRANKQLSPIQYGQGARVGIVNGNVVIATGVVDRNLSEEIYADWTHVWSPNVYGTIYGSVAKPKQGIREIAGADARNWYTAGLILGLRY